MCWCPVCVCVCMCGAEMYCKPFSEKEGWVEDLCVTPLTLCPLFVSLCCSAMCVRVCACACARVSVCAYLWMYSYTLCCLRSRMDCNQEAALCLPAVCVCVCMCVCCCCICPCCGTHCGRGSYRSCSPALLAEKNSHDSALKKLPGSPFTAGCAETLGWSVFVLAPLLVVTLTLKHLTFPAELRQRIMPARLKQPETDSDGDQHIKCNMVN